MSMFVHEYVNKIMRRLNDLSNQERFLRHVATSLQSLDDGAKQTFSDANGFKIVTDLQQIVTTASEKKQIPCHYGSLLESNLYKEQADFGLALCGSIFSIFSIWLYMAVLALYGSTAHLIHLCYHLLCLVYRSYIIYYLYKTVMIILSKAPDHHIFTRPSASRNHTFLF